MIPGLSESEIIFLNQNLIQPLKSQQAKVFLFGSRAKGHHHKFSDIDLLFVEDKSHPISFSTISSLLALFEESRFPYKIDLVNDKNLAKSYRPSVEANKIEI